MEASRPGGASAASRSDAGLPPPEDQAEAERLLGDLVRTAERILTGRFGGAWPGPVGNVVADLLDVARGYAEHPEAETARGWCPLALLRGVRPTLLRAVNNWNGRGGEEGPRRPGLFSGAGSKSFGTESTS
jgi:hypothetical protein